MLSPKELQNLMKTADDVRIGTIETIGHLGVGHVGGALSVVDILTLLYFKEMHIDPHNPLMDRRDLLVLSKGHAGPALYTVLAKRGYFPESWLLSLNEGGTKLPSHCDRTKTPGIDMTTGSLGQGLSAACGMAYACRTDRWGNTVYAILGDGECDEGQNWEAAMFASQYGLDNLIAFTDYNKLQIDGTTDQIMSLGDIEGKWQAFGWDTLRCNGHDMRAMDEAIETARKSTKPVMIILDTVKAYGAPFAENQVSSHNMQLSAKQVEEAVRAIEGRR